MYITFTLKKTDKGIIRGYHWPLQGARRVACIVHGIGEYGGRYDRVASCFLKRGIASISMDLRGHGESRDPKGHCAPREAVMADYLFTNTVCTRKADRYYWLARMLRKDKATSEKLRAVFSVRTDYLNAAFSAIDEDWGGTEAFIVQGLGVGPDRLEAFRNAAIAEGMHKK